MDEDRFTHVGVDAEVLPTRQTHAHEPALFFLLLLRLCTFHPVGHEAFELRQGLLNLWHCTRAIDELPLCWVELVQESMDQTLG